MFSWLRENDQLPHFGVFGFDEVAVSAEVGQWAGHFQCGGTIWKAL